ncbi:MAG: hypothetical protein WB777_14080 [Mycobacterium sp.]
MTEDSEIARRAKALIRKHLALQKKGLPAFGPDYFTEVEALEALLGHVPAVSEYGSECEWKDYCRCTHQGCSNGFLNVPRPGTTAQKNPSPLPDYKPTKGDDGALFRCPTCAVAQQIRKADVEKKAAKQNQPVRRAS